MVLQLILSIVLQFATAFLLKYCLHDVSIWNDNDNIPRLHQPKLSDLNDTDDAYTMQKYVEEVICPANVYFITVGRIKQRMGDSEYGFLYQLILHAFTCLIIGTILMEMNFIPIKWLCFVLALVISVLGTLLASFVYKRTALPIKPFEYSSTELREMFDRQKEYKEFNISDENAFNNFVIGMHCHYIYFIEDKIVFRSCIRKVVFGAATLIYLLFFWRQPNL